MSNPGFRWFSQFCLAAVPLCSASKYLVIPGITQAALLVFQILDPIIRQLRCSVEVNSC